MRLNTLGSRIGPWVALVLMVTTVTPAMAHHSFDTEYDSKKTTTISGIVTKLDWVNPHAFVYLEFKDQTGKVKTFKIEMGPPYALTRQGWKKEMVKIGDKITVEGACLAKDGSDAAGSEQTTRLVLANGQKLAMR
jgi:hypothetical protein